MSTIEVTISIAMFFGGAVGALCLYYLREISQTLSEQRRLVGDIDKRVVRLEAKQ